MRRQAGFTLVDLTVAMTIGGILVALFATVVLVASNSIRAANDSFRGDDDVQVVLVYLNRDTQGARPPTSGDVSASELRLTVPNALTSSVLRVTYTYATDPGPVLRPTAKITRTVTDGSTVVESADIARNLQPNYTQVFESCGAGCIKVNIPFIVADNVVVRTARFATRVSSQ